MSKQDDELRKALSYIISVYLGSAPLPSGVTEVDYAKTYWFGLLTTLEAYITKDFNPKSDSFTKAEVLRALEPLKQKPTHGTCCTCQTCGYPNDNECRCDENDFKLRITEALGLATPQSKEGE